jgi:protoporphyrinogen oxidase
VGIKVEIIKNVVLGAGIAGLAFASEINEEDTVIFEKEEYYGGLCRSFQVDGFSFDTAVHLSFTNIPEARDFFDRTPHLTHKPVPYNYFDSLWLKHPVMFNLAKLPTGVKVDFIRSFAEERYQGEIDNYEDWLMASYGKAAAERLYNVYTKKYWTVESRELSTNWIGPRINVPDFRKILEGAFETETGDDYYVTEMRYPEAGRFQSFLQPLAEKAKIRYGKAAVRIDPEDKRVYFSDGTCAVYENLISSIPLPELAKMVDNAPEAVRGLSEQLRASKISIVSAGFSDPDAARWLWFYIYDQDILAARVNSPSRKSPANAPAGSSSLQFEIYHSGESEPDRDVILENVRKSLLEMKLCSAGDIKFLDYRLIPYGNVIFFKGMEGIRDEVKRYLNGKGIALIGRFGEWDYLWSDQSYMSGINSARNINSKERR